MGLPSSFLFAGAHNVLAALWRVDDASTRILMEDFYQGIADGLPPTLALQQAQRQLRDMPTHPYHNPYYWAGFILIGDGE